MPKAQSFPKTSRLLTPNEFQSVFKQPIRSKSTYFTILASANQRTYGRLGIIVSKRTMRLAVQRNAARRIIRESFRVNKILLAGLDVVVLVRSRLPKRPNAVYFDGLQQQWRELATLQQKV